MLSGRSTCDIYFVCTRRYAGETLTLVLPLVPDSARGKCHLSRLSVPEDSMDPEGPPMCLSVPLGGHSGCVLSPAHLANTDPGEE